MPAKIIGETKSQQLRGSGGYVSGTRPPNVQRRISTGSNGYFSGPETSPESTPVSMKSTSYPALPSYDHVVAEIPDLRRPPPLPVSLTGTALNLDRAKFESVVIFQRGVPPLLATSSLIAGSTLAPPSIRIQPVDPVSSVTLTQVEGQYKVGLEKGRAGHSATSDMLQMSPCLRNESSPCADDLGNYAMHVSQMELVWHGEFDRLFAQYYPHAWYLVPTFYPPSDRWRVFKDSAKVRFSCQECGHGWTSMKGRVIFWFHLNYTTNSGYVMFKLYGQQCQKCKNGSYEHAMWYPEEVVKVIGNVYNRVGQLFYGFVRPPLRIDRRQGKPRNQHNADLCQACKEGLCKEEWSFS